MSKSKATPGPWRASAGEVDPRVWGIFGMTGNPAEDEEPQEEILATVWDRTCEEPEANARLIAAAPGLLAICEETADALESDDPDLSLYWLADRLREAVAKARGEGEER